jgi:hypothetical protein
LAQALDLIHVLGVIPAGGNDEPIALGLLTQVAVDIVFAWVKLRVFMYLRQLI